jgi:hypothetical protein
MVSFLSILVTLAPYLDQLIGEERKDVATFWALRTCNIEVVDFVLLVVRIDPYADISYSVMLGDHPRKNNIQYPLKNQIHTTGTFQEKYQFKLAWMKRHFTYAVDSQSPLKPVPKSRAKSQQKVFVPQTVTVYVYGAKRITEYRLSTETYIWSFKQCISKVTCVQSTRQSLYYHSRHHLVPMRDDEMLLDHGVKDGDYFTMLTHQKEWEDSSSEEYPEVKGTHHTSASSSQTPAEAVKSLLDSVTMDQLREEYEQNKVQYRSIRDKTLMSLQSLRDFEKKIRKCK